MGSVYEARHARLAGRYAVKVLHPEIQQHPDVLQRFEREARITSALRHPGIVQVIDFNTTPDGAPYLVMEYLEGEDLAQLLAREGPLPLTRTARIASQIAGALAAAHRRGVVHRDLKPQNIFLVPSADEDEPERAKVLDFGISKIRSVSHKLTAAQVVMGTPQFMAPEQAEGKEDLDAGVDQFTLGAIVYEMLTGRPAFVGDTVAAVVYQIVHQDPVPVRRFRPDLPASVEQVLSVALAKDRARRFLSVTDFARRLRAAAGDPVTAAESGSVDAPAPDRSGRATTLTPAPSEAGAGAVDRRLTTTLRRLTGELLRWRSVVGTRTGKIALAGGAVALFAIIILVFAAVRSGRPGAPAASTAAVPAQGQAATIAKGTSAARTTVAPVVAPIAPAGVTDGATAAVASAPGAVPFELASDPSGVPVWIDGKPFPSPEQQVLTWARGELPIGTHKIELTKAGYQPWRRTVEIRAGRPNRFLARLQKEDPAEIFTQLKPATASDPAPGPALGRLAAPGRDPAQPARAGGSGPCSMTVGSVPWTELWVDGTNTHRHTPVASFLAPCGPHRVELRRGDLHIHLSTEVDLTPGRNAKLIYHFDEAGQLVPPPR